MDSFKYQNEDTATLEKAKAISSYNKMRKITTLFRAVELFVFLFILSKFSPEFSFSFSLSFEHFKGILSTLISSQFVFILGNTIVLVLFLLSRHFSGEKEKKGGNFYEEYVEKCRNDQILRAKEEERALKAITRVEMRRSYSGNMEKPHERCHELRRSQTEMTRRSTKRVEDEMSGEEFRQTVEAFIARQQRILREEELSNGADSLSNLRTLPHTTSIKKGKL